MKRLKKISICLGGLVIVMSLVTLLSQWMAFTPKIQDTNGKAKKGSITELTKVELNGRKEWISIRGEDTNQPVLLFLAGGPGGSQMAAVRHELGALEEHFIVVNWDQPGAGKSYSVAPKNSLTVEDYIADGIALTEYLCKRFNQQKIYLVGESWGSALAVFMAKEQPQYYEAVIGTGQMIDFLETEMIDYEKAKEIARAAGDTKKLSKLEENGYPPYYGADVTWKSAEYLNYLGAVMQKNPEIYNGGYNTFRDLFSSEYGLLDKINYLRGIIDTFNYVYPQLYDVDLRVDYAKLEVPIYFFIGRHDINAPVALVEDYMEILEAPYKEMVWFEHSGHSPWISENEKFVEELVCIKESIKA